MSADLNILEEESADDAEHAEALYAFGHTPDNLPRKDQTLLVTPAMHRKSDFVMSEISSVPGNITKRKDQDVLPFVLTPVADISGTMLKTTKSSLGRTGDRKPTLPLFGTNDFGSLNQGDKPASTIDSSDLLGHDEALFGAGADWWLNLN